MNKRLSKEQKRFINQIFQESLTDGFLDLEKVAVKSASLASYKRSKAFTLLNAYKELIALQRKKEVALITSPTPLKDTEEHLIRTALKGIQPTVKELAVTVDPSLLGGLRIKIGDTYYDSTLPTKLGLLKGI